jgi:hypothetical protein
MTRADRLTIASRRLLNVLRQHVIANARTLENKICDGGPFPQRVEAHVLTEARRHLEERGEIRTTGERTIWYYLKDTSAEELQTRLAVQESVYNDLVKGEFTKRLGQSLEIAMFRALRKVSPSEFVGAFPDLEEHDDSTLYSKEEPPNMITGVAMPGKKRLDFLLLSEVGRVGVETKNIREWLYPGAGEIKELLLKCCTINAVPVLVARRLPYITFSLLGACGVMSHQMLNQLFPMADAGLAAQAKDKNLLGYHDIRIGNHPSDGLLKFIGETLPRMLPEARKRFENCKDVLAAYAASEMLYEEFAARLVEIKRKQG